MMDPGEASSRTGQYPFLIQHGNMPLDDLKLLPASITDVMTVFKKKDGFHTDHKKNDQHQGLRFHQMMLYDPRCHGSPWRYHQYVDKSPSLSLAEGQEMLYAAMIFGGSEVVRALFAPIPYHSSETKAAIIEARRLGKIVVPEKDFKKITEHAVKILDHPEIAQARKACVFQPSFNKYDIIIGNWAIAVPDGISTYQYNSEGIVHVYRVMVVPHLNRSDAIAAERFAVRRAAWEQSCVHNIIGSEHSGIESISMRVLLIEPGQRFQIAEWVQDDLDKALSMNRDIMEALARAKDKNKWPTGCESLHVFGSPFESHKDGPQDWWLAMEDQSEAADTIADQAHWVGPEVAIDASSIDSDDDLGAPPLGDDIPPLNSGTIRDADAPPYEEPI